ncbi:hypothetical protein ANTPLA_LOCUS6634 [Anthophora plagiata]
MSMKKSYSSFRESVNFEFFISNSEISDKTADFLINFDSVVLIFSTFTTESVGIVNVESEIKISLEWDGDVASEDREIRKCMSPLSCTSQSDHVYSSSAIEETISFLSSPPSGDGLSVAAPRIGTTSANAFNVADTR